MSFFEALWLGIVQGLTEFFPVSSSGHLVIFASLLGIETEGGLAFEVAVHVATLAAIVLFYHRRIGSLLSGAVRGRPDALRYLGKLAVGTLPAAGFGFAAKDLVEQQFSSPRLVAVLLLITGGIVWTTRRTSERAQASEPSWVGALVIGLAQACAILPGISRSGATVSAALALGVAPRAAAEFSFLLGIVAIAGAAVLTIPDWVDASPELMQAVWTGGAAALVSGMFAIWLFVKMLREHIFYLFAWWAWAAGLLFLAWQQF
jgi:undecaprenyl-diphosphatase